MIVYGDPGREESVESMVTSLRAAVARIEDASSREVSCDQVRRVLIQAGELEQAVCDAPSTLGPREECRAALRAFRTATSLAANAFHIACEAAENGTDCGPLLRGALARMRRTLDRALAGGCMSGRVWVKLPDGFAFETLFPERYREAARRWAAEHAASPKRDVLVIGIRSIGTTLSAVVTATLRAQGFRARRMTVRGHAATETGLSRVRTADWALVVDGASDRVESTAPAVADALATAGMTAIHLFPGRDSTLRANGREPMPNDRPRLPTYRASLEEVKLGGLPLAEALWRSVSGESGDPLARVQSCDQGSWRSLHYADPTLWPAVNRALERPKLLCEGASGRRVHFKFAGLSTAPGTRVCLAEIHARRLARLAREGLTPAPLGIAHGFVATEWVDGTPLRISDASPALLRRIGAYIAKASGPPLSSEAARAARNRLETMLCANVREAIGDDAAGAALSRIRPIPVPYSIPRCGDGHLAPHEWIATRDGRVLKTDAGGHDFDVTWTGRQPVVWDLAGALLEWNLDEAGAQLLLEGFNEAGGGRCAPSMLSAYGTAYAAHRVGVLRHGLETDPDSEERERLQLDYDRWRERLTLMLGDCVPALQGARPQAPVSERRAAAARW